jgi:hypothetical protein
MKVGSRSLQPTALRALAQQFGANVTVPTEGEWYSRLYGQHECELFDPEDWLDDFLTEDEDG